MIVSTTNDIAGQEIQATLGEVTGIVVRTRGIVGNFAAGLRGILGGDVPEYQVMVARARQDAMDEMKSKARALGGNAVVGMRFVGSELGQSMSEVVAYGTAVVVVPIREADATK